VPILPLIDLLMLISISGMMWAFTQKALWLAFDSAWTVLGLTPYDFLLGSIACLLLALALAARTWVKANEAALLSRARLYSGENGTYGDPIPDPHPGSAPAEPATPR